MSGTEVIEQIEVNKKVNQLPQWNVIILDDAEHSFDYVIDLMRDVFSHPVEKGLALAMVIHFEGQVTAMTTTKERAELKQELVHSYGPDKRIPTCKGSMTCIIEPAE